MKKLKVCNNQNRTSLCVFLFWTVIIVSFFMYPVVAMAKMESDTTRFIQREEYVQNTILRYIIAEGIDFHKSNLSISQAFEVVGADLTSTKEIFLFSNDECVGVFAFSIINGDYSSSFVPCNLPIISTCAKNRTPIAVIAYEGELRVLADEETYVLLSARICTGDDSFGFNSNEIEKEIIIRNSLCVDDERIRTTKSLTSFSLAVPIVGNGLSPDTNEGLCWAASLASIINYRCSDQNVNYTALGLYNMLKSIYTNLNQNHPNYPEGTEIWEKRALDLESLTYTYVYPGTTFFNVKSIIDQMRPIYCGIERVGGQHAVDICGYAYGDGTYSYKLMDPNLSYYTWVTVNNTQAINFIYQTTYGYTYTLWFCHCY